MVRHLAGLADIVEDFDTAVSYYQDTLRLEVEIVSPGAYAEVKLPGVAHFGIWARTAAGAMILGDVSRAGEIPLGISLGFEVDDVAAAVPALAGLPTIHGRKAEPWGQVTARFLSPSGALCEVSETPPRRRLTQGMAFEGEE